MPTDRGWPIPLGSAAPDVPHALQQLADAADADVTLIDDRVADLEGFGWTAFTPTLTGLTLGNGTLTGAYRLLGDTIEIEVLVVGGSTTSITTTLTLSGLPVAVRSTAALALAITGYTRDGTGAFYALRGVPLNSTSARILCVSSDTIMNTGVPFAFGSTDTIALSGRIPL